VQIRAGLPELFPEPLNPGVIWAAKARNLPESGGLCPSNFPKTLQILPIRALHAATKRPRKFTAR
jgi:hypothetical protein